MAENTKIEWCDHTLNWWTGCEAISPACANCYAAAWAKRAGRDFSERRATTKATRRKALKWEENAAAFEKERGYRQRVFVNSLADVFDNKVPQEWRDGLFEMIRQTPSLDYLLLSKRIGNAERMLPPDWGDGYPNVWLGATVVTRSEFDRDVEKLRAISARIRFLSMEPLIERMGEIDLTGIDWVIVGGESGSKAREMRGTWAEQIRYRCEAYGTAFFFKQGSTNNWRRYKDFESFPPYLQVREWPRVAA